MAMLFFVVLYVLAALKYPGGSWIQPTQEGFSFWHNYLCDLLDQYAVNGELNTARHLARASLAVLCTGLLFLWNWLPGLFPKKGLNVRIMKFSGLLALSITFFLASGTHDITVRIAGFFGLIGLIGVLIELYRAKYRLLFLLGMMCVTIFLVNYYIYETGLYIERLPFIQKITFTMFIIWFWFLNVKLYVKLRVVEMS